MNRHTKDVILLGMAEVFARAYQINYEKNQFMMSAEDAGKQAMNAYAEEAKRFDVENSPTPLR